MDSINELMNEERSVDVKSIISDPLDTQEQFKDTELASVMLDQPSYFFVSLFIEYSKAFLFPCQFPLTIGLQQWSS